MDEEDEPAAKRSKAVVQEDENQVEESDTELEKDHEPVSLPDSAEYQFSEDGGESGDRAGEVPAPFWCGLALSDYDLLVNQSNGVLFDKYTRTKNEDLHNRPVEDDQRDARGQIRQIEIIDGKVYDHPDSLTYDQRRHNMWHHCLQQVRFIRENYDDVTALLQQRAEQNRLRRVLRPQQPEPQQQEPERQEEPQNEPENEEFPENGEEPEEEERNAENENSDDSDDEEEGVPVRVQVPVPVPDPVPQFDLLVDPNPKRRTEILDFMCPADYEQSIQYIMNQSKPETESETAQDYFIRRKVTVRDLADQYNAADDNWRPGHHHEFGSFFPAQFSYDMIEYLSVCMMEFGLDFNHLKTETQVAYPENKEINHDFDTFLNTCLLGEDTVYSGYIAEKVDDQSELVDNDESVLYNVYGEYNYEMKNRTMNFR
uniref:CNDH2_C domain-containing protein n=1 Tax=Caenorhabditis tropicalis TaxID=1561998 RepID=A0A1I7TZZ0_9PELO